MEKNYKILDHDEPLPYEEIRRLYTGYWVFITNVEKDDFKRIVRGIPVVVGSKPHAGATDGIYIKYRAAEYGLCAGQSFLPNRGFISALRFVDKAHA